MHHWLESAISTLGVRGFKAAGCIFYAHVHVHFLHAHVQAGCCIFYAVKCSVAALGHDFHEVIPKPYSSLHIIDYSFGPAFYCTVVAAALMIPSAVLSFIIRCIKPTELQVLCITRPAHDQLTTITRPSHDHHMTIT